MPFQLTRHPTKRTARYRGSDSGNTCLMPANTGVNNGGPRGFYSLRQLNGFVEGSAVFYQIEHRQAEDNNKVITGTLTYRSHHLNGKTHAVGILTAPLVIALVGTQSQEFVDEIPFRPHHFYAIVARFPRQLGAMGKIFNQLQHFIVRQLMWRKAVNGGLNSRWGHQMRLVAVTPGVQDLQGDFAAFVMHGIGNDAMVSKLAGVVQHRTAFHPHAGKRRRNTSTHN